MASFFSSNPPRSPNVRHCRVGARGSLGIDAPHCARRRAECTHLTARNWAMQECGNLAVKLLRTYTTQIEALAKLRRGGEQRVRIEHVHVHEGAQAIVGNVVS